jgi:hypothetical protein
LEIALEKPEKLLVSYTVRLLVLPIYALRRDTVFPKLVGVITGHFIE